jgi:type VI secretion system ImpM family protein
MLGSIIKGRTWCWVAVGKHPAAADYIRLGDSTSLLDAVADWVAKGYDEVLRANGQPQGSHSWRFWLRGVKKDTLICGLGRDSSDRIGRPYPILIMGEGLLKGWEKNWRMLPAQLKRSWQNLEYIASHRYDDARAMEEEIRDLNPPQTGASENQVPLCDDYGDTTIDGQVQACREQLHSTGFGLISLNNFGGIDSDQAIGQCHGRLNGCCKDIPRGVFIGGTPQHTYICAIEHPLATADFVRLWTV